MKKFTQQLVIMAACTLFSASAMAQSKALYLSSVNGSKLSAYDGQTRNVTMYRNVYTGWNTLCLPFDMSAEALDAAFGTSCRLEALKTVTMEDGTFVLNFTDVKAEGVHANVPYLLYFTGENSNVKLQVENAVVHYDATPQVEFSVAGAKLCFSGANTHIEANGQYGIYVRDNADANFTLVGSETNGFYATRCFIKVDGVSNARFISRHGNEATAIQQVQNGTETDGVVYGINGVRQNGVQQGMNVVDGKKVLVK